MNDNYRFDQRKKAGTRRAEKEKEPCHQNGKEMILNYYEIQDTKTEALKGVLKYLNGRYVPLVGLLVD
jgi:hypothetical protein